MHDHHHVFLLRAGVVVAFVLAVPAALIRGDTGHQLGVVTVTIVVALPLLRVAWLVTAWVRERDLRFAAYATCLLGVVAAGAVIALLS